MVEISKGTTESKGGKDNTNSVETQRHGGKIEKINELTGRVHEKRGLEVSTTKMSFFEKLVERFDIAKVSTFNSGEGTEIGLIAGGVVGFAGGIILVAETATVAYTLVAISMLVGCGIVGAIGGYAVNYAINYVTDFVGNFIKGNNQD